MLRSSYASMINAVLFSHYRTFCSSAGQCRVPTRYHQHSPALTHSLLYLVLRAFLAAAWAYFCLGEVCILRSFLPFLLSYLDHPLGSNLRRVKQKQVVNNGKACAFFENFDQLIMIPSHCKNGTQHIIFFQSETLRYSGFWSGYFSVASQ